MAAGTGAFVAAGVGAVIGAGVAATTGAGVAATTGAGVAATTGEGVAATVGASVAAPANYQVGVCRTGVIFALCMSRTQELDIAASEPKKDGSNSNASRTIDRWWRIDWYSIAFFAEAPLDGCFIMHHLCLVF